MYLLGIFFAVGLYVWSKQIRSNTWHNYTLNDTCWDWVQEELDTPSKMDGWK